MLKLGSASELFHNKMTSFSGSFWIFVFSFLHTLFRYFNRIRSRYVKIDHSQMKNSSHADILSHESNEFNSKFDGLPEEPSSDVSDIKELYADDSDGKNTLESNFDFKFKFPTYEEFGRNHQLNSDSASLDTGTVNKNSENEKSEVKSYIRKYEFQSAKNCSCFIEKARVESFGAITELYSHVNEGYLGVDEVSNSGLSSKNDYMKEISKAEAVSREVSLNSGNKVDNGEEENIPIGEVHVPHSVEIQLDSHENDYLEEADVCDKQKFLSERNFIVSDSDSEYMISSHEVSVMSGFIGCTSDDFLTETDFELTNEHFDLEDYDLRNLNIGHEPDEEILEKLQRPEESRQKFANNHHSIEYTSQYEKLLDSSQNYAEPVKQNSAGTENEFEDSNGLEALWEHQDLIEQLKIELKKVRATGLPTIMEDSESPKIMEDLKPWKIDEKFQHGDRLGDVHKFYKSYRERMRKFDILNYQKMYAIGALLQSADPFQSFSISSPPIKSKLRLLCKRKKSNSNPAVSFIRELQGDLEMVYVGQLCLSWEFLHWQYEKAFDIWGTDPCELLQYNEVAGEFQQFEVILQRFIENEPFQFPRVENYVKNRCFMHSLLQVPVLREDNSKERKRTRKRERDNGTITSEILLEILEESIRTIWRFIRADKYSHNITLKGKRGTVAELQDPVDSNLFNEIQTDLIKKEKLLKDLRRNGKCILKRYQKQHNYEEEGINHLYYSQVDLKLVTRVLNMSRITTEQLIWCHNKLENINFVNNRKIHVDPSFLLFPC